MRSKTKMLKDMDDQISNLWFGLVDSDLDRNFPSDMKPSIIQGYKERIKELQDIKARLKELLI